MEETHEYANELGKQGGKNPRKIPKFSINHERSSRTIEKKSKITPTHSSDGILKPSDGFGPDGFKPGQTTVKRAKRL